MPLDNVNPRMSYESDLEKDAMSAIEEVMGRRGKSSDIGESSPPAREVEKGGGVGAASRTKDKSEVRDDGRDERGRFNGGEKQSGAADDKQPAAGSDKQTVAGQQKPDDKAGGDQPAQPAANGPPPSFSLKTKAEWDRLPQHVKDDIIKRETEVGQGLAALRDYKDLKPYAELAAKHNTSIKDYIDRTLRIESVLKQDLGAGLAYIAQNAGLSQVDAARVFAQLALKFGGQHVAANPQAGGMPHGQAADPLAEALRPILSPMLTPLMQTVEQLKGTLSAREQADRNAHAQSLADAEAKFKADPANRFVPELEPTMIQLFEKGMVPLTGNHLADLKTAYDMAARMHPEVSEALIEQRLQSQAEARRKAEQEAADKARNASRSLTGSRIPGSRTVEKEDDDGKGPKNYEDDLEADVRKAIRAVRK